MNMSRVLIVCFVPLVWCVSEILSMQSHGHDMDMMAKMMVHEEHQENFSIDTTTLDPTAPAATQSINLFLPEGSQHPIEVNEKAPKFNDQTRPAKKTHRYPGTVERILTSKMDDDNVLKEPTVNKNKGKKQQSWQIPSPLSPLATSDPKATNSSKRQTEFIGAFVPSQEIGSYDSGEGFVPHALHEAKYLPPPPPPPLQKPHKHDSVDLTYNTEPRLPLEAARGMSAFEHDFEDLKSKYPELNDLVNNYPIVEEIMKQKLAEKFRQTYYGRHHLGNGNGVEENSNRWKNNNNKYGSSEEDHEEYDVTIQVHSNSKENTKDFQRGGFDKPNFPFDFERPKWEEGKKQGGHGIVPAGEFYQEHRFPLHEYYDDKNHTDFDIKDISHLKPKKAVSPWKKVLHLVTTLLPVGLLLTALTPNVITISNVADKNYPIRQRSVNDDAGFIDLLKLKDGEAPASEEGCEDLRFCESAVGGRRPGASAPEAMLWTLVRSTPDHAAEAAGVKRLFEAVRRMDCSIFACDSQQNRQKIGEKTTRSKRYKRMEEFHVVQ